MKLNALAAACVLALAPVLTPVAAHAQAAPALDASRFALALGGGTIGGAVEGTY